MRTHYQGTVLLILNACLACLSIHWAAPVSADDSQPDGAAYSLAVVRLPSHGASATIIYTEPGRSYLLGCAHAFRGLDRTKKIVVDVPNPNPERQTKNVGTSLVALDYQLDLSLVILNDGPLPYCVSVGPDHFNPSRHLLSVGFDNMKWPATVKRATITQTSPQTTWTAERPWHGRSGGALIDIANKYVVGVVSGYETSGNRRGVYVSHEAIVSFLQRYERGERPPQRSQPIRSPSPFT